MKFDDIVHLLGDFGPFQRRICLFSCIMVMCGSWATLIQVFATGYSDHWCKVPWWNETSCELFGYDEQSCSNVELTKLANIPLATGNLSQESTDYVFEKCVRYDTPLTPDALLFAFNNQSDDNVLPYNMDYAQAHNLSRDTISCDAGWEYDRSQYTSTITQEFNLVCGEEKYIQIAQSVYYAGFLVGSGVFGALGDAFGRHPTLLFVIGIKVASGFALAIVRQWWAYAFVRFFQGAANVGLYILTCIIGTEFVGSSKRNISLGLWNISYAVGYMIFAGVAYLIRDWRMLEIAVTAPACLYFIVMIFMPESARWLLSRGDKDKEKAKKIILKAARVNKVSLPPYVFESNMLEEKKEDERKPSAIDMFRHPSMRQRTFILMYHWGVCTAVYHGLNLSTSDLGVNVYVSFFVSAAVELPAHLLTMFCIEWPVVGRRRLVSASLLVAGGACLITIFMPLGGFRTAVAMAGKFGISMGFAVLFLYTIELYPTPLRSIGIGICSMAGRSAGIIAPLILLTREYWAPSPLVIFGTTTVFAGLLTLLLPESRGRKLAETVEEGENFGRAPAEDTKGKKNEIKNGGQECSKV